MRFLHCSDVHITADYRAKSPFALGWRRWPALAELSLGGRAHHYAKARQTLSQIAADATALGVDHLIVSGDLTAYALPEEFDGARDALKPWVDDGRRCTVIHGNHDTYTPQAVADRLFEQRFLHLQQSDLPTFCSEGQYPFVKLLGDEAAVVGLLSARVPQLPGFSFGVIGPAQLASLRALVTHPALDGRAVLVAVHHAPLNAQGEPDKRLHGLTDARALFEVVRGERFAVLHGHIHRRYHHAPTESRPHLFGAGSSTQVGREGYWVIEVQGGKFTRFELRTPGQVALRAA
jgi:3',5'-cyclic AMP phosphodiesterase CpdA